MKKAVLWIVAVLITLASVVVQRMTGPSYPLHGKSVLAGETIAWRLDRSAEYMADHPVKVVVPDLEVSGSISWKPLAGEGMWIARAMSREGDSLVGLLPRLPRAGKLEYRVTLQKGSESVSLTGDKSAVLRYKGHVPGGLLIPHILVMFLAMLFSNRAGLAAISGREETRKLVLVTLALLVVGGFILGPLVQKFSFGVFWSGFPVGLDLTDNKTLIALIVWIAAVVAGRKGRRARGWVVAAAVLTLVVYMIPHSLMGSEIKPGSLPR